MKCQKSNIGLIIWINRPTYIGIGGGGCVIGNEGVGGGGGTEKDVIKTEIISP